MARMVDYRVSVRSWSNSNAALSCEGGADVAGLNLRYWLQAVDVVTLVSFRLADVSSLL